MLGKMFLKVNSTSIPNPVDWNVDSEDVENVLTSESGKDLVNIVRLGKRTFSGKWQLSSHWLATFRGFATTATITLKYENEDITCRCRNYSQSLVKNSAYVNGTNGLWEVTLDFIEL